jgi:four helix bundle protein
MDGRAERENVVLERSYAFALSAIHLARELRAAREFELATQVLRSGTSIGANVEEAQAAQTKRDFVAKLAIASKEARETSYWLRLIRDSGCAVGMELDALVGEAEELRRMLSSIVKSAQQSLQPKRSGPQQTEP